MDQAAEQNLREIIKARRGETTEQAAKILADERDDYEKTLKELAGLLKTRHNSELVVAVKELNDKLNDVIKYHNEEIKRLSADRRFELARSALSCVTRGLEVEQTATKALEIADSMLEKLGKSPVEGAPGDGR